MMVEMRMVCGVCPRHHYPQMHVLCDPSLSPPSTSALLLLLFRPLRRLNSELDYRGYFLGHLDGRIDPAAVSRMKVAAIIKLRGGDARRKNFAKVIPLPATEGEASEAG